MNPPNQSNNGTESLSWNWEQPRWVVESQLPRGEPGRHRPPNQRSARPIQTPDGHPLLFEAYYAYDTVVEAGSRLWWSFAPISLIGLLMLEVVEIPLAWSMARWLRERQREREVFSSRRSRRQTSNVGA